MIHLMKRKLFLLTAATIISSCGNGQSGSDIEIVTEFYTQYNAVWTESPPSHSIKVLHAKMDSLLLRYCAPNVIDSVRKYRKYGQDFMTNDLGSANSNRNLRVIKDTTRENLYLVSFDAYNSDPSGRTIKQHVMLNVHVTRKDGSLKIDSVQ
jgi:hypothetical protein